MDIKFDSLASLSSSAFAFANSADYPDGRYSGAISQVDAVTSDSQKKFCLRFKISTKIDKHEGKPDLYVTDQITFTTRKTNEDGSDTYGISWAAVNSFCDLTAIAGADRNEVYTAFKALSKACTSGNHSAIRDTFIAVAQYATMLPGTRVAPNIVWSKASDDGRSFANIRGSKSTPSYLSAVNERDQASEFTADDTDSNPAAPTRRRNLVSKSRK
tara:strand:+ start:2203 stop:2847 length:645 start_codon:yes stop_codon:yes gene_type:complete